MPNDRYYIILPGILLIRIIITILMIAGFSPEGCAQEKQWKSDTLIVGNLESCINYAKLHNIRLKSLKLDRKYSEQELLLSRAAQLPDLVTSATQHLTLANTVTTVEGNSRSKILGSGDYGLNSSLTLYRGGYLTSDIRQKKLQVESAELSIAEQENDITIAITRYYLNVLLAKERIKYGKSLVSTSIEQVSRARNQLNAGSMAKKDL